LKTTLCEARLRCCVPWPSECLQSRIEKEILRSRTWPWMTSRRSRPVPSCASDSYALSFAHCHSSRYHRFYFSVGQALHHRQEPRSARTNHRLPHRNFRQNRNIDLRRTQVDCRAIRFKSLAAGNSPHKTYLVPSNFRRLHISRWMRSIALQSAIGGMALSLVGMMFAATGYLSPVAGAIGQEVIDVLAVLNALRAAFPPKVISDIAEST
jgi:hypothetical protein